MDSITLNGMLVHEPISKFVIIFVGWNDVIAKVNQ